MNDKMLLVLTTVCPETLARLANDNIWSVRHGVAENPNTPPETLDRLAIDDDSFWVRFYVARNPNTLPETLERLANDENSYVRSGVARNPNTPQYILTYLKIKKFLNRYE
jgi:hypothetical protein